MKKRVLQISTVLVAIILILIAVHFLVGQNDSGSKPALIVYSADAYWQETSVLLSDYHNVSGVNTAPVKSGGSLTDAQQIGQGAPSDVFVSVSLGSYGKSYLQSRYSGWAVAFASDQMVLAYSNATMQNSTSRSIIGQFGSALSNNSTSQYNSAFTSLTSGDVKVGIANPNSDPAGFRGWLVLEMAGYTFHNNDSSYFINRIGQNRGNVTQSDAAQLVSPLISGQIQFLFIYRSAAIIKGLHYIQLPPSVNLGSLNYQAYYSRFTYNLTSGHVTGAPIFLYVTALNGSSDMNAAVGFAEYIINSSGKLKAYGLTPIAPALLYGSSAAPASVRAMLSSGKLSSSGAI